MRDEQSRIVLVLNGASSSEQAPSFISIVKKEREGFSLIAEQKTTHKGGAERFPIYFQEFVADGKIRADQIDLISVIVGPGSFTGLRASIAFARGMQMGLNCPAIPLRRGQILFPWLRQQYPNRLIWHVTNARRDRVFVENSQDKQVRAFNITDIEWPDQDIVLSGEAVSTILPFVPASLKWIQASEREEGDALLMAECAEAVWQTQTQEEALYPLYIDPPKASLPARGLRNMPE